MSEKAMVHQNPKPELVEFLEKIRSFVAELPEWKKGVLETSSQVANTEARQSILASNEVAEERSRTQPS